MAWSRRQSIACFLVQPSAAEVGWLERFCCSIDLHGRTAAAMMWGNCGRTAGMAWPWLAAYSPSHSAWLRARIRQLGPALRAREVHEQFSRFGGGHGRQFQVVQEVLTRRGALGVGPVG